MAEYLTQNLDWILGAIVGAWFGNFVSNWLVVRRVDARISDLENAMAESILEVREQEQ